MTISLFSLISLWGLLFVVVKASDNEHFANRYPRFGITPDMEEYRMLSQAPTPAFNSEWSQDQNHFVQALDHALTSFETTYTPPDMQTAGPHLPQDADIMTLIQRTTEAMPRDSEINAWLTTEQTSWARSVEQAFQSAKVSKVLQGDHMQHRQRIFLLQRFWEAISTKTKGFCVYTNFFSSQ